MEFALKESTLKLQNMGKQDKKRTLYDFRNEYVCVSDLKCLLAEEEKMRDFVNRFC
jgi:hypothetical protein